MLSVPIAIERVTDENMDEQVAACIRAHADRVFLCLFKNFMDPPEKLDVQLERFRRFKDKLHASGMEVGIWVDSLNHGASEIGYKVANKTFTPLEGVFTKSKDSFCPLDKEYTRQYQSYLKRLAQSGPDIIMFDDDYRFSVRNYGIGCFCKLHRDALFKKTGKRYGKLRLFNKVYKGPGSPLRNAWLDVLGDSLLSFARAMREAVDSVDENIRLGCCMCIDTLDFCGTDALTLARAFAGKTKPYFRTIGAPYWNVMSPWGDARSVAEYTRQEMAWFDGEEVEMFAEGDVYPRPRYVVPANYLECYDAYLHADGKGGILKYMFDYNYEFGYETGYLDHHRKNYDVVRKIADAFKEKNQIGIEIFEPMKKFATWEVDKTFPPQKDFLPPPPKGAFGRFFDGMIRRPYYRISDYVEKNQLLPTCSFGRAQRLISQGLPTLYTPSDGVVIAFGESARHLPESYFNRGVILDSRGAKILTERGIDVGFLSAERTYDDKEKFSFGTDLFIKKNSFLRTLCCSEKAEIVSTYLPSNKVASYYYVNEKGQSFYVLGLDGFFAPLRGEDGYFVNYYRQRSLRENIRRLGKKPIVASCQKSINLSLLLAQNGDEYAVGLFNFFIDGVVSPKIDVSVPIRSIECINCKAKIVESGIQIEGEIPPYGFCCVTFRS